jgi:hypothetical protein
MGNALVRFIDLVVRHSEHQFGAGGSMLPVTDAHTGCRRSLETNRMALRGRHRHRWRSPNGSVWAR